MSTANDITKLIDLASGVDVNYRLTTSWYDGSPITDDKCDGDIYRKKGSEYFVKTIDSNTLLKVVDITHLREMNGYYEGQEVSLLGYYQSGDKDPLTYKFTIIGTYSDDGGSVIKTSRGYWLAQFNKAVDIRDYGASPTLGGAENFTIIKRVIESHNNVIIKNGQYNILHPAQTSYFGLRNNSTLTFEDASIKVLGNNFTRFYVLFVNTVSNVTINNPVIIGDKFSHIGTTGQWGYGIFIFESNNVEIYNATCNEHWGDGLTINGGTGIKIYDSTFNANRRQGCSIGKVGGVDFYNCIFSNTDGTTPGYGVDIENDYSGNNIKARFYDCIFDSNGLNTAYPAGFCLSTHLADNPNPNDPTSTTTKYEVELFNPIFINCGLIATASLAGYGYLRVHNPTFTNTLRSAILIVDTVSANFLLQVYNPKFYDCVTTTTPNSYDNVITTQINGTDPQGTRNVHIIRPYITNNLSVKTQAIRLFESSLRTTGENVRIEDVYIDKGYTIPITVGDGTNPTIHPTLNITYHKDCFKNSIGTGSSVGPNFNRSNSFTSGISIATNTIYMQTSELPISESIMYVENRSQLADLTINFGITGTPATLKVFPYVSTLISSFKVKPNGWIKYKKIAVDAISIVDHSGLVIDGMTSYEYNDDFNI
jgi:hypothetical protein